MVTPLVRKKSIKKRTARFIRHQSDRKIAVKASAGRMQGQAGAGALAALPSRLRGGASAWDRSAVEEAATRRSSAASLEMGLAAAAAAAAAEEEEERHSRSARAAPAAGVRASAGCCA